MGHRPRGSRLPRHHAVLYQRVDDLSTPSKDITLAEVIRIARDIQRAKALTRADWEFRKNDIGGAWSDQTYTDRLRVMTLGPLSMGEHLLNRGGHTAIRALLTPALSLGLFALKGKTEAKPFGHDLAGAVAEALIRKLKPLRDGYELASLCYMHRDYCGMGLSCSRSNTDLLFEYSICDDGWPNKAVEAFTSRAAFVGWLAQHSDLSLSGVVGNPPYLDYINMGNQRLTQARLLEYIQTE